MFQHEVEAQPRNDLEGRDTVAARAAQAGEEADRCGRIRYRQHRGEVCARAWEDLEHRSGNDAKRAFRADEEILEIVAGVVLAQSFQAVPHAAVGQYHLEPECELAGVAVAKHVDAARVGREVAADLAAAFRAERKREEAIGCERRLLDIGENTARFDRHGVVQRVGLENAVHAPERDHDLTAVRRWRGAAAHAGIAALGDDGGPGLGADFHHGRDFGRAAGAHDHRARAAVDLPPVDDVRLHVARVGDQGLRTDGGSQALDEGMGGHALIISVRGGPKKTSRNLVEIGLRVDGHRVGVRLEPTIYTAARSPRKTATLPEVYAAEIS